MHLQNTRRTRVASAALALALLPALAACGEDAAPEPRATASGTDSSTDPGTADARAALRVTDPWVKATDGPMTAAFGTLVNDGDEPITVTSATAAVAGVVELHETVENADGSMAMRPREGGFVVPAGGSVALEPGGQHVMLMDLERPLVAGEVVPVTLNLEGGGSVVVEATVKPFEGADEKYQGGSGDMGGMEGMGG